MHLLNILKGQFVLYLDSDWHWRGKKSVQNNLEMLERKENVLEKVAYDITMAPPAKLNDFLIKEILVVRLDL